MFGLYALPTVSPHRLFGCTVTVGLSLYEDEELVDDDSIRLRIQRDGAMELELDTDDRTVFAHRSDGLYSVDLPTTTPAGTYRFRWDIAKGSRTIFVEGTFVISLPMFDQQPPA
jgi:hypothetical protein